MAFTGTASEEGIRARKHRETSRAIHRAALARVSAEGLDGATVAAIAADADISPRTFFNYFPTKEDAITGVRERFDQSHLEAFAAAEEPPGDLLDATAELVRDTFSSAFIADVSDGQRRELLSRYPELSKRAMARISTVEQRIADAVAERIRRTSCLDTEGHDVGDVASLLVMTVSSAVRFAIRKAVAQRTALAEIPLAETLGTLRTVLRKAL